MLGAEGRMRCQLQPAATLWRAPPNPPAVRAGSRAVHKLDEALRALRQNSCDKALRLGVVIDVGVNQCCQVV